MQYKMLFILIEGNDDEYFFDRAIKPLLAETYESILLWQYAQKPPEKIRQLVRSIKRMKADYIFVGDIDDLPCVMAKKEQILAKKLNVDDEKIMIVVKEIESWYLAGLNDKNAQDLTRTTFVTTDALTKENFNSLMYPAFDSRVDFMQEILNRFSVGEAENRNVSFRYFIGQIAPSRSAG